MNRRNFIQGAAATLSSLFMPQANAFLDDLWTRPREIWIVRRQTGEHFRGLYWENGLYVVDAYREICKLMRDVHTNQQVGMDPRLIDIMYGAQTWTNNEEQKRRPIMQTSGFRGDETNSKTEGAVKNSTHTQGKGADWYIERVPIPLLGQKTKHFMGGGVGIYADRGFLHTDTGRLRSWKG